jgi:hypothetical protein
LDPIVHGLKDLRVVEHATVIAGPYCGKLFADAGADVIKLEAAGGDPLRSWSATGSDLGNRDGALFRYLNASKRSVVGTLDESAALIAEADLLIEDLAPGACDRRALLERNPGLVVVPTSRSRPSAARSGRAAVRALSRFAPAATSCPGPGAASPRWLPWRRSGAPRRPATASTSTSRCTRRLHWSRTATST